MLRRWLCVVALAGVVLAGSSGLLPAVAQTLAPVDVELVLATEGSQSLDDDTLRRQRASYALALESPEVQAAIASGLNRRIALLYLEWGGPGSQPVIVDWTLIEGPASAAGFAARLRQAPRQAMGDGALSAAIERAAILIDSNAYAGRRRVIDIAGDGPDVGGRDSRVVRDETVRRGMTINALAINRPGQSEMTGAALMRTYAGDVAGGADSFVVLAADQASLAHVIRRKLVQEIGGAVFLGDLERRWGARAWSALPGPR